MPFELSKIFVFLLIEHESFLIFRFNFENFKAVDWALEIVNVASIFYF